MHIIKTDRGYFGPRVNEWSSEHKNIFVITGLLPLHMEYVPDNSIGRVVQVRLKSGAFGSDCVLLRHLDGRLIPHENQSFYIIPEKYQKYLEQKFAEVYVDDSDMYEYSLQGNQKALGFIINYPITNKNLIQVKNI
jgi:hypothetical protein